MNHAIIFLSMKYLPFTATVIKGSGRGKGMGIPTINLSLSDVPKDMQEGIYAAFVIMDGHKLKSALHYGPRPVHKDVPSLEVHLIDDMISDVPKQMEIHVITRLRDVRDFPSEQALVAQILEDIAQTRAILNA